MTIVMYVSEHDTVSHIADTVIQAKDVRESSIQTVIKRFAKRVFKALDKSHLLAPEILGINVCIYLDVVDFDIKVYLYAKVLPPITVYTNVFVNRDLEIVNKQIYQRHLPEIADLMTTLHEKMLQAINLMCAKEDVCQSYLYTADMLEYFGVDMGVIWGFNTSLMKTKEHIQHAINMYDKYIEILSNFETYRQFYEIEKCLDKQEMAVR